MNVGKDHPLADPNGYAYLHILVWVSAGNPIPKRGEIVHHINEDKEDNRIENFQLMTNPEHTALHSKLRGARKAEIDGKQYAEFPEVKTHGQEV